MISPHVRKEHGHTWRGVWHFPINVCMHCGESDDPEGYWAEDVDGDRMCLACKEKENTMGWINTEQIFPLTHPRLQSLEEAQDSDPYIPLPDDAMVKLDAAIDRRKAQSPVTVNRRVA